MSCLRSNKWQCACKFGDGSLPVIMALLTFPENDTDCGCQPGLRHQVREHMAQGGEDEGCGVLQTRSLE